MTVSKSIHGFLFLFFLGRTWQQAWKGPVLVPALPLTPWVTLGEALNKEGAPDGVQSILYFHILLSWYLGSEMI